MNIIYALVDPRNDEVRYIGKTNNPKQRLSNHLVEARRRKIKTRKSNWIASLLRLNLKPEMRVLAEAGEDWASVESSYIAEYINKGHTLYNSTSGGEGINIQPAYLKFIRFLSYFEKDAQELDGSNTVKDWKRIFKEERKAALEFMSAEQYDRLLISRFRHVQPIYEYIK